MNDRAEPADIHLLMAAQHGAASTIQVRQSVKMATPAGDGRCTNLAASSAASGHQPIGAYNLASESDDRDIGHARCGVPFKGGEGTQA
jgi:hypothetical protein